MNNFETYHTAMKALNALQNAIPRDQSEGSIKYHVEAVDQLKDLIKKLDKHLTPSGSNVAYPYRWLDQ